MLLCHVRELWRSGAVRQEEGGVAQVNILKDKESRLPRATEAWLGDLQGKFPSGDKWA